MSDLKKVIVTLPEELLVQVDSLSKQEGMSRSAAVRDALSLYLEEQKKIRIRERMESGYMEMGMLNVCLAEECLAADAETLAGYEKALKE